MKIGVKIGQNIRAGETIGNVEYQDSQTVRFVYLIAQEGINSNNESSIAAERKESGVPQKLPYSGDNGLIETYPEQGVIFMNYNAGWRIPDDVVDYRQYGIMTTPRSDYISAVSVYKKEIWYKMGENGQPEAQEENLWHLVTNRSDDGTIYDFNVANNRYYKYLYRFIYFANLQNAATTQESSLTEELREIIVPVRVAWNGWTLTELHEVSKVDPLMYNKNQKIYNASLKDVWKFKYNISLGDTTQQTSKTTQDTLARFPKFIHGPKNTLGGQVTCLLGRDVLPFDWQTKFYAYGKDEDNKWGWIDVPSYAPTSNGNNPSAFYPSQYNAGGYQETLWPNVNYNDRTSNAKMDLLGHWRQFCYSGNPKLLKDSVGNKYIVQIHDPSEHMEETWDRRPISITFSWTQIEDADNCLIIEEVG